MKAKLSQLGELEKVNNRDKPLAVRRMHLSSVTLTLILILSHYYNNYPQHAS